MSKAHLKYGRLYVGGYDLSGYTFNPGTLGVEWEAEVEATLTSQIKAALAGLGQAQVTFGPVNGVFDNAAGAIHTLHAAPGSAYVVTYAQGVGAAPAVGDPVFCYEPPQRTYAPDPNKAGAIGATMEFGMAHTGSELLDYGRPWGVLLHPKAEVTAENGGTADHDHGAQTTKGGFGILHVFDGDGTATFAIEHSATDSDAAFDSTGAIVTFDTTDASSPFGEAKALAMDATVERYLRWQVTLGTATAVTFLMAFVRGV